MFIFFSFFEWLTPYWLEIERLSLVLLYLLSSSAPARNWRDVVLSVAVIYASFLAVSAWFALKALSQIKKPIEGIPIMPVDFMAESQPTDWWKRILGLPIRVSGFGYCFGSQVMHSSKTGGEIIHEAHKKYGPIFQTSAFGHTAVYVCDPCVAKRVLLKLEKIPISVSRDYWSLSGYLWNNFSNHLPRSLLMMPSGKEHLDKKALFKTAFHENMIHAQESLFLNVITRFTTTLTSAATNGETVKFDLLLSSLTIEVLCEIAMQFDLNTLYDKENAEQSYLECYKQMSDDIEIMLASVWLAMVPPAAFLALRFPSFLIPFKCIRDYQESRRRIDKICEKIYENMMVTPEASVIPNSFVEAIRKFSEWPGITKAHCMQEIFLFLVAGHDTTSHTLSWFMFEMANHPELQTQCQAALDSDGPFTRLLQSPKLLLDPKFNPLQQDNITTLPNLVESALKESMRLHPTVPGSTRCVTKSLLVQLQLQQDEGIKGSKSNGNGQFSEAVAESGSLTPTSEQRVNFILPEGTFVNVNTYSLHHNESVWGKNADKFEPSRWTARNDFITDPNIYAGGGFTEDQLAFAPFSYGHRGCLGKNFAMTEIRLAIKVLLARFTVRFADEQYPHSGQLHVECLTMRPKDSLPVILALHNSPKKRVRALPVATSPSK